MTYYEKPDRNKIYRNARARYPSWPARYALKFANDCLAYRLLFPKATRPVAHVENMPNKTGTGAMIAIGAPSNPWNPEYTCQSNGGKWRCYQFGPREHGIRIVKISDSGFYCDSFQDRLAVPIVVALPAQNGLSVLLSGYQYTDESMRDSDDGCVQLRVDTWETCSSNSYEERPDDLGIDRAMCAATRYAESVAEDDRFENDKYEAERQIEEKKESICGLFKSRHKNGIEWAREQVNELVAEVRQLTDEPWTVGIYY